jgi:hypothetical protein
MRGLRLAAMAVALALAQGMAIAGRTCEQQLPLAANVQRSMDLAQRTAQALEASGAQVVVLARAGQDLSRYQLRWSHLGFAYRDEGRGREGGKGPAVWRVVHKLNTCGSAHADLYRQGLGEFFMDDLHRYEAAWVVPNPDLQEKLLPLLRDNDRIDDLHTRAYNMVAYPLARQYQQSNQWALETIAMSQEPAATTRERAQAWLQLRGYEPTALRIPALTRLGARMGSSHIAFDDHPNNKRFADRIETVTVDSVFDWMARAGLAGGVQVLR